MGSKAKHNFSFRDLYYHYGDRIFRISLGVFSKVIKTTIYDEVNKVVIHEAKDEYSKDHDLKDVLDRLEIKAQAIILEKVK